MGVGIYGVFCENEIFGTKSRIKYRNLLMKSLNHGGVFTAWKIILAKSLLTMRGVFTMGVFIANTMQTRMRALSSNRDIQQVSSCSVSTALFPFS